MQSTLSIGENKPSRSRLQPSASYSCKAAFSQANPESPSKQTLLETTMGKSETAEID